MPQTFYTGVSLLSSQTFVVSGGDWYHPPYPFFVYSFDLTASDPTEPTYTFPSVPGNVWDGTGVQNAALFSGMSFSDEGAVFASFSGTAQSPLWVETVPGVSGNWWEVGSTIQSSLNGSICAYALTSMDHYDPLGPKKAEVLVMDTSVFPVNQIMHDALWNDTAVEATHLSSDASVLVLIAAWDPNGSINSSIVRVYDVLSGSVMASWSTGWVDASCLSPDGKTLVLTTCDSENAIEVYSITDGRVTQLVNSTYPEGFPSTSTFTYAETCQISSSGGLWVVFPLWWGGAINQTAVAYYASLPTSPTYQAYLPPTSLWLSEGITSDLQDSIISSTSLDDFFVYTSWGGKSYNASGGFTPPTIHVFTSASPSAPILQISTPASEDPQVSGSIQSVDLAMNGTSLLILCEGLNNVRCFF